ncbi:MAG: hypothetical protein AB8H86_31870 [Polyangiales bacterium]
MGWRFCWVVLVCACGSTSSDVAQPPSSTEAEQAATEQTAATEQAAAEQPAVDEGAGVAAEAPAPAPPPTAPAGSAEPAAPAASAYDVSETEARRLCEAELDEDVRLISCAFGAGHDVPEGRVDVLEFVYVQDVRVSAAMLILRSPEDMEYPGTFTIAEAEEMPGLEEEFTLGTLSVTNGRITLPVETVSTEYPNTGDPDEPTGATEERERFVVQCDAMNGVYDCERVEP